MSAAEPDVGILMKLIDSLDVGVAALDREGRVVVSNAAFAHVLDRPVPVGASFYDFLERDGERVRQLNSWLMADHPERESTAETTVVLATGERRSVELRSAVICSGEGTSAELAVTLIDRTRRAEVEAESDRLRAIFEDIGELIGVMSPDGTVLSMNQSALEFFGSVPTERGLIQFVPPASVSFLMGEILPVIEEDGRWEGEIDLLRSDGAEVLHHVTLRRHASGRPGRDYFWAIARDRSMARKAAEVDALARMNAEKDQFIAGISHELRTPLTSIRGFADLVAAGGLSDGEAAEYVEFIRHEAYAMSAIVEDLLVAARLEAGRISIVPRALDLRAMVDEVAGSIPGVGIQIENLVPPDAVALADEMRCRQVLRNLLGNAVRHGGGRTWVECDLVDERVYVHVCDDGQGVDPTLRESIFEAYVSRPNDGLRPESVGLGLTVSRQLARLMGGDVEYQRTDHSRFTLALPRSCV